MQDVVAEKWVESAAQAACGELRWFVFSGENQFSIGIQLCIYPRACGDHRAFQDLRLSLAGHGDGTIVEGVAQVPCRTAVRSWRCAAFR